MVKYPFRVQREPEGFERPAPARKREGLHIEQMDMVGDLRSFRLARKDGSLIGFFSTEKTINEYLDEYGDHRRVKNGRIV